MTYDEALLPLAQFLAKKPVKDKIHQEVLADLYDKVNAIRDNNIAKARKMIKEFKESSDFFQNNYKQECVFNLQAYIDEME